MTKGEECSGQIFCQIISGFRFSEVFRFWNYERWVVDLQ